MLHTIQYLQDQRREPFLALGDFLVLLTLNGKLHYKEVDQQSLLGQALQTNNLPWQLQIWMISKYVSFDYLYVYKCRITVYNMTILNYGERECLNFYG